MRGIAVLLLSVLILAPAAEPAYANDWECFGPGKAWCAHTPFDSRPEDGWGVQNKARLPRLVVETVLDAPGNQPRLGVRISPIPYYETARVIVSLRQDEADPASWRQFFASDGDYSGGTVYFALDRRALEALLEGQQSAMLYVFAEVSGRAGNHKVSHKVSLRGLREALRFARLGP